jgi:excisionase family DNA binding protein
VPDDLITAAEAAHLLGCSVPTVHRRIARGELAVVHRLPGLRGAVLLRRADVLEIAA